MYSLSTSPPASSEADLAWSAVLKWADEHQCCRSFNKDETITLQTGLVYVVTQGVVRLGGQPQDHRLYGSSTVTVTERDFSGLSSHNEAFVGFVGVGQPFEVPTNPHCQLRAYAHIDQTQVMGVDWAELEQWPQFRHRILSAFRHRHNRQLTLLSTLGQRRAFDRLLGFLELLMEEYGEPYEAGYCLPWPITHAQLAGVIGATRVTVTRLMGQLRQRGIIACYRDNQICFPLDRAHLFEGGAKF